MQDEYEIGEAVYDEARCIGLIEHDFEGDEKAFPDLGRAAIKVLQNQGWVSPIERAHYMGAIEQYRKLMHMMENLSVHIHDNAGTIHSPRIRDHVRVQ